jgi:hypothetical protein
MTWFCPCDLVFLNGFARWNLKAMISISHAFTGTDDVLRHSWILRLGCSDNASHAGLLAFSNVQVKLACIAVSSIGLC